MSLFEAWYSEIPTVTTRHTSFLELQRLHEDAHLGSIIPLKYSGSEEEDKELATAIESATTPSESAKTMVMKHYMASNMVDNWTNYFRKQGIGG